MTHAEVIAAEEFEKRRKARSEKPEEDRAARIARVVVAASLGDEDSLKSLLISDQLSGWARAHGIPALEACDSVAAKDAIKKLP